MRSCRENALVSAWTHCRGAPGSATMLDISCSAAFGPHSSVSSGCRLVASSRTARRTTGAASGRKRSCRWPNGPFMPRQLTPPKKSLNEARPSTTSRCRAAFSAATNASSSAAVAGDSASVTPRQPRLASAEAQAAGLRSSSEAGTAVSVPTPRALPISSRPSRRASASALAAAAASSKPLSRPAAAAGGRGARRADVRRAAHGADAGRLARRPRAALHGAARAMRADDSAMINLGRANAL